MPNWSDIGRRATRRLKASGRLRAVVHAYRRNFGPRTGPYPRTKYGQLADTIHWQLRQSKSIRHIEANAARLREIAPTEVHRHVAIDLLDVISHDKINFANDKIGADRTAPHRTAPHRTAPHRTAPHRTAPHRTAPHRTAPHRTAPHRTAPHRTAPHRTAPHRTAPHRTAPHRTAPHRTALSVAATAMRETDTRAEKIVSRKYRFVWIANCKVASRSMISALCAADPSATVLMGRSIEELVDDDPELASYYSFAFVRHPYRRAFSFYADKFVACREIPEKYRLFIEPYHGLESHFSFAEVCEWLHTPYGSDHFAERHWVSQEKTIRFAGGRLPDFIGHFENLHEDWQKVMAHLGMPSIALPHLNANDRGMPVEQHLDDYTTSLLRRRYAHDLTLGNYDP